MLTVSFPKSFKIGDRLPCRINNKPKDCIWINKGCLVFVQPNAPFDPNNLSDSWEVNDARLISDIFIYEDEDKQTFICPEIMPLIREIKL